MCCKRPVFMNECSDFFIVPILLPEFFIGSKLWDGVFEEYAAIAVFSHRCNLRDESRLQEFCVLRLMQLQMRKHNLLLVYPSEEKKWQFCLLDVWHGWNYSEWDSAGWCGLWALCCAASVPRGHQAAAVLARCFHISASCRPAAGQLQFLTRGILLNSACYKSRFEFFLCGICLGSLKIRNLLHAWCSYSLTILLSPTHLLSSICWPLYLAVCTPTRLASVRMCVLFW